MTMRQISFIRIYWDASDPQDPGWAWRAYHDPGDGALPYELESGALLAPKQPNWDRVDQHLRESRPEK